jgi:hypothetical protein
LYKVYFTNEYGEARSYSEETLEDALATTSGLRNQSRYSFVTMVGENPNQVGKMGVDSVEDGKLPSGEDYTWRMRR